MLILILVKILFGKFLNLHWLYSKLSRNVNVIFSGQWIFLAKSFVEFGTDLAI